MPKDTTPSELSVTLGQCGRAGLKPVQQDFHGAALPEGRDRRLKGIVLALADGISPSAVSAEAAEMAVRSLLDDYYAAPGSWSVRTAAARVISATNGWLHAQNRTLSDMDAGQVCTLTALILKGREGHVFHVGDSRLWRVTPRGAEPLTTDHTLRSGGRAMLGRAMGLDRDVEIDYLRLPLAPGDIFVLTTDGVHGYLSPARIAEIASTDPEAAAEALVEAALAAGSPDNLTAQVLRIDALPEGGPSLTPDLPLPPRPEAGAEIDGFHLIRPLHETARSHVWLAAHTEGRAVLKFPSTDTAADPESMRRLALEEWVMGQVNSPHVAAPVPRAVPASALYVAVEQVPGISLRQWMTDNPRPSLAEVRDIVSQIAAGLRALHRADILHQDLRPENVMIDDAGTVRLIDLGLACVEGIAETAPGLLDQAPATYQYTAPEHFSGDITSWRSEQFALGVIAYEMLTGALPYGPEVARIRSRAEQARLRYRPAVSETSGVPGWIDAALRRAVHPDPARRYDALSEFVADLSHPSAAYTARRHRPLAERDPVRFWQAISALLALACVILIANL